MMRVEDLLAVRTKSKALEQQREKKIKYRLFVKSKEKMADGHERKASKLKTKKIQKKTLEVKREKVFKPKVELQKNVNVVTFVNDSKDYLNYYKRTKGIIHFSQEELLKNIGMLRSVGQISGNPNPVLSVEIVFSNPIEPVIRPFQVKLPHCRQILNIIMVAQKLKPLQQNLKSWNHSANVQVFTLREFRTKLNDNKFNTKVQQSTTLIFCDFKAFKALPDLPFYQKLNSKTTIFPIDCTRVPHALASQYKTYQEYIQSLCEYSYFTTRVGIQFTFHVGDLQSLSDQQNMENVQEGVPMIVARLLEKNKLKNNVVEGVNLRTTFSIPIPAYTR